MKVYRLKEQEVPFTYRAKVRTVVDSLKGKEDDMTEEEFNQQLYAMRKWTSERIAWEIRTWNVSMENVKRWMVKHIGVGNVLNEFMKLLKRYKSGRW